MIHKGLNSLAHLPPERRKESGKNNNVSARNSPPDDKRSDIDPLELYLCQIRQQPLLSRDEEVEIAKEMERCRKKMSQVLCRYPHVIREAIDPLSTQSEDGSAGGGSSEPNDPSTPSPGDRSPSPYSATLARLGEMNKDLIALTEGAQKKSSAAKLRRRILAQMEAALSELGLMDGKALEIIQQLKEYAARIARAEATIRDCGKELNLSYEETLWALNNDCRDTGRKNASAINRSRHAYQELRQAELETGRDLKQLKKDVQVAFAAYNDFEVAKKQLVEANLRLAFIIASKYAYGRQHLLDLIQEGNIGLMRAAEKFDHRFGCKFATYASWWVRQAITKYIDRYTNMIRIPANVKQLLKSVVDAAGRMQDAICPDCSMLEDDSKGQLSEQKIQRIVECLNQHPIVSLQMPVGDGGSELSDIIEDQDSLSPEKATIRKDLIEKTRKVLSSLSPNEQRILEKRFGIGDEDESTLQEIGCEFGQTRERIRQIQADCLDRMRHPSRISELDSPEE